MADGGSINLRMSLQGAEQIRAELATLGPAGSRAARDLDRAMRQPSAGMKVLDTSMKEARVNLEGFGARAGPVGSVLQSLGGWGLAAAAGFAAVAAAAAAALQVANQATQAAAAITDSADRIGIGTEALQQWRYVADEAGVPVAKLEADLEKLNGVLGKFKMGIGDAKLKPWFEELGISKADLDSIQTADQLMLLLADRLGQVADRSKQVAGARAFGIEASLPAIRLGADGIRDLLAASEELGVVLDADTIQKLDEADRKAELAGQQLKTLAHAAVEPLATHMANLGAWIANVSVEFSRIEARAPQWLQMLGNLTRALPGVGLVQRAAEAAVGERLRRGGANAPDPTGGWNREAVTRQLQALAEPTRGDYEMQGHTTKGGGSSGPSAEQREADRRAREIERLYDQLDREMLSSRRDVTRERWSDDTPEDRAQLAKSMAALERKERDDKIAEMRADAERLGAMDERRQLLFQQIESLNAETDAAEDARIIADQTKAQQEARLEAERTYSEVQIEILHLASSTARTAEERRIIELELLEIAQRRQRAELELALAAETDPREKAGIEAALAALPRLHAAQREGVLQSTAGPVEGWWRSQRTDREAQNWVQQEALDALDGVNRGLIDAWRNADSAGDAFDRMGKVAVDALGRVADALLEVALQRMLIQPLANSLFGGGSGGGGGLLGNFLGGLVGGVMGGSASPVGDSGGLLPGSLMKGMARGGVQGARGLVPVGEYGIELMDMPAGARIYDTERTERMIRDAAMGGGRGAVAGGPPIVNMPVKVINNGSERMNATTRQTPEGIDVILDPIIRNKVTEMGGDGSLARANALTPRGKER